MTFIMVFILLSFLYCHPSFVGGMTDEVKNSYNAFCWGRSQRRYCPAGVSRAGQKEGAATAEAAVTALGMSVGVAVQYTRSARITSLRSYSLIVGSNQPSQVMSVRTSSSVGPMMASTGAVPAS